MILFCVVFCSCAFITVHTFFFLNRSTQAQHILICVQKSILKLIMHKQKVSNRKKYGSGSDLTNYIFIRLFRIMVLCIFFFFYISGVDQKYCEDDQRYATYIR